MPNQEINLSDALDLIAQSKTDIKGSIEDRDIVVGDNLTEYSSKIDSIKYQGLCDSYPFSGMNESTSSMILRYNDDGSVVDVNSSDITLSILNNPNSSAWPPPQAYQVFPEYFSAFNSLYNPNLYTVNKLVNGGHVYIDPIQQTGFGWCQVNIYDAIGKQNYYKTYITPVDTNSDNTWVKIVSMSIFGTTVTFDEEIDSDNSIEYICTNPVSEYKQININLSFKLNGEIYVPTTNDTYTRFYASLTDENGNDYTNLISYSNNYQTITIEADGTQIPSSETLHFSLNFSPCEVYDETFGSTVSLYNWSKTLTLTINPS